MNVLYIDKLYPYPPNDGRNIRVFNLLKQLSRSHSVTLICNGTGGLPVIPIPVTVKQAGFKPIAPRSLKSFLNLFSAQPFHQQYFHTRELARAVREHVSTNAPDAVILDSVYLAGLMPLLNGLPVVINEHNFEPGIMQGRCRAETNPFLKAYFYLQYRKVLRLQRWAVRQPDVSFVCVSTQDAAQIRKLYPFVTVGLVPNGVDVSRYAYSAPEDFGTICFLGSLAWAPNVDGLAHFVNTIWPRIKSARPDLRMSVVGQDPDNVAARFHDPDIMFTGAVDDVIPHVRATSVFVVPLRYGGGTKLKVLEAMALGRPVVTTSKGAEGIDGIVNGGNAVIADSAEAFAAAVVSLLGDRRRAVAMGAAGRELTEQRYDWNAIGHSLIENLEQAARSRADGDKWLAGHNIICFSNDWNSDPLSKHHIMTRLARRNRVLWINSIGLRRPTVTGRDISKAFTKLVRFMIKPVVKINGNLFVLSPIAVPFHGHPAADLVNRALLRLQVRFHQRRLVFDQPILWSFLPNAAGLLGSFNERLSLYYITDDFTQFTGHPEQAVVEMEKQFIDRADVVIASARRLAETRHTTSRAIPVISHGVNHQRFARALGMDRSQWPADIRVIRRPVMGFYGEINDWLDLATLAEAARLKPEWSFVLLGRVAVEVGNIDYLLELPNIHWLGQKRFDELPAYCAAFDVALIPMKLNDLTRSVNPLKLREYLAAGVPVVSAPLPEVLPYGDVVKFATTAGQYVMVIEELLKLDRPKTAPRLSQRVAGESWDVKVAEISKIIEEALAKRL